MAGKKPAKIASGGKSVQPFWTPKPCAICGNMLTDMKTVERLQVVGFSGASANKKFIWRHKGGICA